MSVDDGIAISVRDLGKRFTVGTGRRGSSIVDRVGRMVGGNDRNPFGDSYIWALQDVSFDIERGRVVALLGRNGSGKTTLVRILARVTSPTSGRAVVYGRVGALFQLGTGFHPELTGRENIELSGAVLGMTREDTNAVFDEIVTFAEIGDYLDAPVKHYSSGMYARLAYSVSAHLDAEILLIDEALSVGDLRFREKCSVHIRKLVQSGRTVVYVSHSLDTVREICDSGIVLEAGRLEFTGGIDEAISYYREFSARAKGAPVPRSVFDSQV